MVMKVPSHPPYSSEALSFGDLLVLQVDDRVFFDIVLFKGTVVLKHFRIEDECRLTWMHALLLEHGLNVFNGVLELDLKFDRFSTFDLCLYEDLVMRKLAASHKFGIPNSITIFPRFTQRPRFIALSSLLFAAVRTQTISITFVFPAKLPVALDVVLWYGSAGRLFGLPHKRVFIWPRPVAVLISSCHAEVLTFIVKLFLVTWARVTVD